MKYNQPYGISDPNAGFINGDPSIGRQGSIIPAESVEYDQREIVTCITQFGLTPSNADLSQLWQATRTLFGVDTGTVNAMIANLNPAPPSLRPGLRVEIKKINAANTGPTTLDIGLGAASVKRANGADLASGDLPANTVGEFIWDGAFWQYANFQGFNATTVNNNTYTVNIPYSADSGTANHLIGLFTPAITTLAAGNIVCIKLLNDITGVSDVKCNTMTPVALKRGDGSDTRRSDGYAGQMLLIEFDGTNFQIVGDAVGHHTTAFRLWGSQQSIPDAALSQITFYPYNDMALADSTYASGVFTCGVKDAGWWTLTAGMSISSGPGAVSVECQIYLNGTDPIARGCAAGALPNDLNLAQNCATVIRLAPGDTLAMWAWNDTTAGGPRVLDGTKRVHLAGTKIGN